ncbi:MAG: type II toxin-antitoxin system VapC family toxin [Cyanobacteria bacterium P01_A01_bin.135]
MIYLDTSFIAPFYINEATSDRVETILKNLPSTELTISDWTKVEFASLLARRVRMGELAREMLERIMSAFESDTAQTYTVLGISKADFDRASGLILNPQTGLRAGAALHLAIAQNNTASTFLSLDKELLAIAKASGMKANSGGIYDAQ